MAKSSPSMIPRFRGSEGRIRLVNALCSQQIVAGNTTIAEMLASSGTIQEFKAGKEIIQQGNSDNDLFFIISGEVAITINGRRIASRKPGQHIGEMAVLDSTVRRSATVTAIDQTTLVRLSESDITTIANQHPEFWRRIATELAARLRERSRFIDHPNEKPIVFIGSSKEALKEADTISQSLRKKSLIHVRPWSKGVFQLSKTTIEDLIHTANECDFAVIILTPDDMTSCRGRKKASPRDNVIFELGLFMGALGRERTFIVIPKNIDIRPPRIFSFFETHHLQHKSPSQEINFVGRDALESRT